MAEWSRLHIGTLSPWPLPTDLSGARSWRVSTPQGLVDIRIGRTDVDFRREVHAHRVAVRHLGPSHGPRLIAAEPRLRTLLTTQPRGRPVDDTAALHILPRIHQDAGHLLRVLHDRADGIPDAQAQAVRHTTQLTQRVLRMLSGITTWINPEEVETVRRCAISLLQRAADLPFGFCHGTFGTPCWRWSVQGQTLSLASFGRAQVLPTVADFARTATLWAERPHLGDAFFTGYGRAITNDEQLVLDDAAVLAGVEDLHHAVWLRDSDALSSAGAALRTAIRRRTCDPPQPGSPRPAGPGPQLPDGPPGVPAP
ncbi:MULTISPECIES: hypothetical protein [unclassified Streptomyces]|uniref:hypothetical protein n=1 Tax=unclassified Streptomyces TaxID=2593676 RepID=UPI00117F740A|nr:MULTISPECIES: hypothetical protein [unclassified Streptomyces]MYU02103.1 hypothetical protein [Streptomyces sp. SID8350]